MLKILGIVLIFTASVSAGLYFANEKRTELKKHQKNYAMLQEIKGLLRFNQPNKADLYGELRRMNYADSLDNVKENSILNDYFLRLGTRDLKSELEAVIMCIERYGDIVNSVEKETDDKCKLSIGAGVLIGTFMVVMLV